MPRLCLSDLRLRSLAHGYLELYELVATGEGEELAVEHHLAHVVARDFVSGLGDVIKQGVQAARFREFALVAAPVRAVHGHVQACGDGDGGHRDVDVAVVDEDERACVVDGARLQGVALHVAGDVAEVAG